MTLETEVAALTTATTSLLDAVNTSKATLDQKVTDATTQAGIATTQAGIASANAGTASNASAAALAIYGTVTAQQAALTAAQLAETNAQGYASLAQATNPDSPIRLNPREISADFTISSAYNAASTGPITIAPGITVTVQDNATWSIN